MSKMNMSCLILIMLSNLLMISASSRVELWEDVGPISNKNDLFSLTIAIQIDPFLYQTLQTTLFSISDPISKKYGNYLTNDEITTLLHANTTRRIRISKWLVNQGFTDLTFSRNEDYITASGKLCIWNARVL